uniref:Calcium-binding protein 7-like n=1 Tax=Pundamilia nyererei TaxID=303518 RepID=A0A3B4FPV1_9CICH
MPMHPVTSTLMYRGICTIPDILSYSAPVNLPEDEVEGENNDTCSHRTECDGQVDFEEFVTLLGPKLTAAGLPDKFSGTDFDSVFWKCDMQKLTVEELKRLLYDTFCDHLSMKDIENIIMTEENHIENPEDCQVDIDSSSPTQQVKQTCVRKSLICAFAIAFIISVMLIAANQVLRSGMK